MKTFTINLTNGKAFLTGFIHAQSKEMPNVDTRPAVLVFPGGGYMMCSDREADPVALAYLAEGYNTFVLRYSVGLNTPASQSFSDAEEAIAYLHEHADELNIDKGKIVVIGFSAGGHLAAWVSVFGKIKPAAAILGYACTLAEIGRLMGKELPDLCGNVDRETPPTFIFATRNDAVVPVKHSLKYADALDRANVGFELHIYGDGAHAMSLGKPFTASGKANLVSADIAQWFGLSLNWLKTVIGDFEVQETPEQTYDDVLDCGAPLGLLMSNESIRPLVLEHLPLITEIMKQAAESGQSEIINAASIRQLARLRPELLAEEKVNELDERLKSV